VPGSQFSDTYPVEPGFAATVCSTIDSFRVDDLTGNGNGPHGNITTIVAAGSVFWSDVTYLFEAVAERDVR
jgi:hypothetical protein